ncbi:hypothetical protein PGT21_013989 [Puccinia graminis f. sp. tritici]|uniref:Uncharacterized protein n=1 Tax=Puccinia graminis f. sp. tritici TaxID=56615 RepID=A0A5B0QF66_PUCGR|nr:hypothetical protein PGT21_013989 [Puccinia graminis f. sp. tritici]
MTSRRVLVLKALLNMADDCTRLVRRPGQPDQSLIAKLSAGLPFCYAFFSSDPRKGSCRFVGFVDRDSSAEKISVIINPRLSAPPPLSSTSRLDLD